MESVPSDVWCHGRHVRLRPGERDDRAAGVAYHGRLEALVVDPLRPERRRAAREESGRDPVHVADVDEPEPMRTRTARDGLFVERHDVQGLHTEHGRVESARRRDVGRAQHGLEELHHRGSIDDFIHARNLREMRLS